jgi:hypothetical protein
MNLGATCAYVTGVAPTKLKNSMQLMAKAQCCESRPTIVRSCRRMLGPFLAMALGACGSSSSGIPAIEVADSGPGEAGASGGDARPEPLVDASRSDASPPEDLDASPPEDTKPACPTWVWAGGRDGLVRLWNGSSWTQAPAG